MRKPQEDCPSWNEREAARIEWEAVENNASDPTRSAKHDKYFELYDKVLEESLGRKLS